MRAILALLLSFAAGPVLAQALPYHADPSARELVPNLTAVPSIRFLTTADFPPFNYRDKSGELVGYNVDLARAICADLSITCTIQAWPWEQAGKALEDGQGDALIAGLAMSPENGVNFDFTNIYLMLPGRFVTLKEQAAAFDPARVEGKTIAVRKGTAHEEFVKRYLPQQSSLNSTRRSRPSKPCATRRSTPILATPCARASGSTTPAPAVASPARPISGPTCSDPACRSPLPPATTWSARRSTTAWRV